MIINKLEYLDDLEWKAKYLQSRGYYSDMTVQALMEFLANNNETPYPWKNTLDKSKKLKPEENESQTENKS